MCVAERVYTACEKNNEGRSNETCVVERVHVKRTKGEE